MVYKPTKFSKKKTYTIDRQNGIVTTQHPATISTCQLSSAYNVWNKNALLSTRPGFAVTEEGVMEYPTGYADATNVFFADFPFNSIPGYTKLCAVSKELYFERTLIDFFAVDDNGRIKHITLLEFLGPNGKTCYHIKNILFIKSTPINGSGIFVVIPFLRNDGNTGIETKEISYYEIKSDFTGLIRTSTSDFYYPVILKDGLGHSATSEVILSTTPVYPEGVNLLGGNFVACFTADERSGSFTLPVCPADDAMVTVHMYTSDTTYITFTVYGNSQYSNEISFMQKQLKVYVHRQSGHVAILADGENYAVPIFKSKNGIRIFSNTDSRNEAYDLLSAGAKPIRFDNRLFIPGGENKGNKIYFSGKNQPLYFCEENSFAVGNTNHNLTALSLQSKYVIAFKEKEIYRISLSETKDVDPKNILIDNELVKLPVPSYKVTRINDSVGCDCPNSIVNCLNRLVWFHSEGAVYTLYGSNLYTEGSVYELSSNISDQLSNLNEFEIQQIFASQTDGYYFLLADKKLFVMDTKTSGFRYLSGHKIADKNYGGLPWYIWQAPENYKFIGAFSCENNHFFILCDSHYDVTFIAALKDEKDIVPVYEGTLKESLPNFSFSTAIFGEEQLFAQRLIINALNQSSSQAELFDENAVFKKVCLPYSQKLKSFIIPISYKKGGLGITINGKGKFLLKNIKYICSERVY